MGTVYVPMGGGGLIAGVSAAIKQSRPEVRVVGVEPSGAAKMRAALDAGHPVTLERTASIADGIMNMRAGDVTFAHVQRFVDDLVVVPDEAIAAAVGWLYRNARQVVEPSGAATTAAVTLGLGQPRGVVAAVMSAAATCSRRNSQNTSGLGARGWGLGRDRRHADQLRRSRCLGPLSRRQARHLPSRCLDALVQRGDRAVELSFVDGPQDLAHPRARLQRPGPAGGGP